MTIQIGRILALLCGVLFFATVSMGSGVLDSRYGLKKVAAFVLDSDRYPIYAHAVKTSLTRLIDQHARFELAENANDRTAWKNMGTIDLGSVGQIKLPGTLLPQLEALRPGADSVILASIRNTAEEYRLLLAWVTTDNPQTVTSIQVTVDARLTVENFAIATENAWNNLISSLPYEGTVLSREGYRVIIDRGIPEAWEKRIIPVYTLEETDGNLNLIETGLIEITDPQEHISFGKIVAENRPYQVEVSNKIRFVDPAKFDDHLVLMRPDVGRNLASISSEWFTPTRRLGFLDVEMGASLLSFSQLSASGKGATSDDVVYPNGSIRGELWVTRAVFFQADISGSMATITPSTTNQPLQSARQRFIGQIGYRFRLQKTNDPSLHIKAGLLRDHLQIEASEAPIAFTSTTYSGLLAGAGARFPINDQFGVHLEVDTLLFPSFEEGPFSSGEEVNSITLVQFSLGATVQLSDVIDLNAKLCFFSAGAELDGTGTRPVAISSIQQDSRALTIGARYYF